MKLNLTLSALAEDPDHAARILRAAADSIDEQAKTHKPPLFQIVTGSVAYDWRLESRP